MTLFSSLPVAKQRLVEKQANTGEVDLYIGDDSLVGQLREVEKIMILVARDSATDRINRLTKLFREAHACKRKSGEVLKDFIERFSEPAAGYLNMSHADQTSAESQKFAIALISNDNLPSQVFTTVMGGLVMKAKEKPSDVMSTIGIMKEIALQAVASLQKFAEFDKQVETVLGSAFTSSSLLNSIQFCNEAIKAENISKIILASISASEASGGGEEAYPCITLSDAISTLEEIKILSEDAAASTTAGAMMAHT